MSPPRIRSKKGKKPFRLVSGESVPIKSGGVTVKSGQIKKKRGKSKRAPKNGAEGPSRRRDS